ncbi:MAG: hypothetical protein LC624_03410 [Halobacteriales archaeon]|nr:hypothetical protein [Halobacteriales archaeon]
MRLALPLALLLLAGLASPAAAQGAACNPAEATLTLQPGQGCHQAPHTLKKGDSIVFAWQVTSPPGGMLDFSTHIHLGTELVNISSGTYASQDSKLLADRDGLFSLLWINNGNDTVSYHYTYHLEYAPAKTPFAPWLGFAALAGVALLARWRR